MCLLRLKHENLIHYFALEQQKQPGAIHVLVSMHSLDSHISSLFTMSLKLVGSKDISLHEVELAGNN